MADEGKKRTFKKYTYRGAHGRAMRGRELSWGSAPPPDGLLQCVGALQPASPA